MVIKPKTFTKAYPYAPFLQYKLEWEVLIEDGEDPAEAMVIAKQFSDDWHKKNESSLWQNPEGMTGTIIKDIDNGKETDLEYEKLLSHLSTIEFREDAQACLETTPFKFTIAAKNIVNSKPNK